MILNLKKVIRLFKFFIAGLLGLTVVGQSFAKTTFEISGKEVPDSILNVVSYCATSWSNYVSSDMTIRVSVSWQELKSNVNAYAKPTNYYAINGIYYPCALAEKIQRKNLNGNDADIEVVINKNIRWHVDTESAPAEKEYDLATTLMHEFAHGLGLIGNITEETLTSSDFPAPTIYDMFICDSVMNPIVSKKVDGFSIKNDLLTSDKLFWGGQFAKAYCGEHLQLYAPEKFNSGSTAYHLHEEKYPTGSGYEMMTPVVRSADLFRKPDVATIAMLADLGWTDYFISVEPIANNSDLCLPVTVSFLVKDSLYTSDNQKVLYSFDGGNHQVELTATGTLTDGYNSLSAEIPALAFDHTISYAVQVVTSAKDTILVPGNFPYAWNTVFFGDDVESPVIEHTPVTSIAIDKDALTVIATITDNFSIEKAIVEYNFGQDTLSVPLNFEGDVATAVIPLIDGLTVGDELRYRIFAMDAAQNTTYYDQNNGVGAWQTVIVEEAQTPIRYFVTDFESDTIANYFSFDKFSIKQETGFANKALHSAHPYANSGADGKYNQYTATLKRPIVVASSPAVISFDEVALVEPGKAGIEYGSFGFWDYVIVEAAKSLDGEWYALGKKGWDSQLFAGWKTRFYSSTKTDGDSENSLAVGDSTLYKSHTINLLENKYIRTGDTVYVRFRLQTDATNFGWGWAIDNLKIQERVALACDEVEKPSASIFPNPCKNEITVQGFDIVEITIIDVMGRQVLCSSDQCVDVSSLQPGWYAVRIHYAGGNVEVKNIVKE